MTRNYRSHFAGRITDFLEQRAFQGYNIGDHSKNLATFDIFCTANFPDAATLTEEIVFAWCNNAKGNGGKKRAELMRNFGRYLRSCGENAYMLPPLFFTAQKGDIPYILTVDELSRFFEATDRYPRHGNSPIIEYTMPVIFRLQYACGMRPQEVRLLRRIDFNFSDSTIYIADGKHYRDRKLAVSPGTMDMCRKYDLIADETMPNRTYFFQSPAGGAYCNMWLTRKFHKCWKISGNGNKRGICVPYDLRHNYATQTLMRWVEDGKDLDAWMPYLSAFMGHVSFSSTFYYIHLLPERLARMDFTHIEGIIPEVAHEEVV